MALSKEFVEPWYDLAVIISWKEIDNKNIMKVIIWFILLKLEDNE